MFAFRLLAAFLALAPGVPSASAEARALLAEGAQAEFLAVGRLNVGGQARCTATLVAEGVALTAAHCLRNARTGADWRPGRLHFLTGYRLGEYAGHLTGLAVSAPGGDALSDDIALVRMEGEAGVSPIPVAAVGEGPLIAVSYGRDRAEAPSIEDGCRVLERRGRMLRTDCEATPGVSGAPLLRRTAEGLRVVGVIVAARSASPPEMRGRAIAVAAAPWIPELLPRLEAAR